MASLNLFTPPVVVSQRRVHTSATAAKGTSAKGSAAKGSGGGSEEKSPVDFVLGWLTKQDQFYETDPILKKVETKNATTTSGRKSSVPVTPPKNTDSGGGFGALAALFSKKD